VRILKSIPIVVINDVVNESSLNRRSRQLFPTPGGVRIEGGRIGVGARRGEESEHERDDATRRQMRGGRSEDGRRQTRGAMAAGGWGRTTRRI
jgi:hypothetical protein